MPETFAPASDDTEFEKAKASKPPVLYKFLHELPVAKVKGHLGFLSFRRSIVRYDLIPFL